MRFTAAIATAILAYTAGSAPIGQSTVQTATPTTQEDHKADAELFPIPAIVAPNGFMAPSPPFHPSSLTGGVLEDHSSSPDNLEKFPTITDLDSRKGIAVMKLQSRGAMWEPMEIDNYHEGVKIDLKNSVLELRDKLDYLNKGGHLTVDQANQQIDYLAKVIATRLRINFIPGHPELNEMLSALQKHIISEIQTRQKNTHTDPTLSVTQQAEQDSMFANLHARYIMRSLEDKLVLLARNHKLNKRPGRLTVGQARQMIQSTPDLSPKDLDLYELQLTTLEEAIKTMIKNKPTTFPASAVPVFVNPLKSNFKLPGEDDTSSETPVEPQPDYQIGHAEEDSGDKETPAPNVDAPVEHSVNSTEVNLHKRDVAVSDQSTSPVNTTVNPTTSDGEEQHHPFWIDFGTPECMKFILDEDLDEAKLAMFMTCEHNAATESPETLEGMKEDEDVADNMDGSEGNENDQEERDGNDENDY